jgi:hypothetical protein
MSFTLTIYDETLTGEKTPSLTLDFDVPHIKVRDLIRDRVYQEARDYNQAQPEYFRGLVQPSESEQCSKGYQLSSRCSIDLEQLHEKALQTHDCRGFMVLVNDDLVEDLDAEIELADKPTVSFLRTYLKVVEEAELSSVKESVEKAGPLSHIALSWNHVFKTISQYLLRDRLRADVKPLGS